MCPRHSFSKSQQRHYPELTQPGLRNEGTAERQSVWNLAMKVRPIYQRALGVWRVSKHFSFRFIFPPFSSSFITFLGTSAGWCLTRPAGVWRVTDYKLVPCQNALWWGGIMVTHESTCDSTHTHTHTLWQGREVHIWTVYRFAFCLFYSLSTILPLKAELTVYYSALNLEHIMVFHELVLQIR